MEVELDYRNAKYQGEADPTGTIRRGYGILIDDDLSFYASQWREGRLNGPTVIYISHGKYIYGEWMNNQPHGLNVFRIADTVIVGEFDNGVLIKDVLIIFEKCNYVAIISQNHHEEDWKVREGGTLKNYEDLLRYIDEAHLPMKPQYFSLSKYLTYISNNRISATPCRGSENCYFGFEEGLGIVFNPNNGVVSVGVHQNKKLIEFGGKYEIPSYSIQGNFQTSETVKFTKERPKNQIYSIFQKMHKRSLNFKNQYFDSKVKLLTNVQELVRAKIDEIINNKHENTFTAHDLNDSLDYHAENLEELNRINQIREEVYQSVHLQMKKTTSAYVQGSPIHNKSRTSLLTPKKPQKNYILNPPSPVLMKKSPFKNKQRSRSRTPVKQSRETNKSRVTTESNISKKTVSRKSIIEQSPMPVEVPTTVQDYRHNRSKYQESSRIAYQPKYLQEEELVSPIQRVMPQQRERERYQLRKQIKIEAPLTMDFQITHQDMTLGMKDYRVQGQKRTNCDSIDHQYYKMLEKRPERTFERSPIKGPSYEDLSERRRRILKDFKNLNGSQLNEDLPPRPRESTVKPTQRITPVNKRHVESYDPPQIPNQYESPLARQKLLSYQSKNTQQNSEMMPLSLHNQNRVYQVSLTQHQKNGTGKFGLSYDTPTREHKGEFPQMLAMGRPFEKKASHREQTENNCTTPSSLTPTRKKTYKYYFD